MSWTTGTQTEALSCANANGVALASAATAVISPAEGAAYVPANFWLPTYGVSKGLLVKANGVLTTNTTGTNNLTVAVVADTTQGTVAPANLTAGTAGVLATTGAITEANSNTNIPWELEVILACVTTGTGATILADGIFKLFTSATAINAQRISSSTANPNTTSTLSATGTQSAYYIELAATWSAASNSIQAYSYVVMGLN